MRSAAVASPEITFIVNYRCSRCHAALEARTADAQTWLRCPECGRASLPPEHMRSLPRPIASPDEDVLVIGPDPLGPRTGANGSLGASGRTGSGRRIAMAVGILISFTMLMISFLDGNATNVAIFGVSTVVLLAVAAYLGRER